MSTENSLTMQSSQQPAHDGCLFEQFCNFAIEGFHFLAGQLSSLVLKQKQNFNKNKTEPSFPAICQGNIDREFVG